MKKFLSILLTAAMLLCMIPAFSLFAAESDLTTIDSADEFVAFAEAANAAGRDYRAKETVKVTADLDMSGKSFAPIKESLFVLDFQGHTVKNLNVTVDNAEGNCGLIANKLANGNFNAGITNIKLENCSLTVNVADGKTVNVGGVAGLADRAYVDSAELKNVTITVTGAGNVGGVIGSKEWAGGTTDMTIQMSGVTINAPKASVGIIIGNIGGDASATLKNTTATLAVDASTNSVKNDTYVASGADKLTVGENVSATVDTSKNPAVVLETIDNADELILLAKTANEIGKSYRGGQEIKITADIDMTGKAWTPIKEATFTLNGQGHTITGLSVTVDSTEKGDYGLLVNTLGNNPGNGRIKDLTVKDSIITVTSAATELSTKYAGNKGVNVGAVVGRSDRGVVSNVNLENVTVKVSGLAMVGGLAGFREWEAPDDTITGTLKNVLIDAPDATVGVVSGYSYHVDGTIANFTANVAVTEGTTITDADGKALINGDTADEYKKTEGENISIAVSAATADSGYQPPKNPDPAPTGDVLTVLMAVSAIAMIVAAVVVSKKRSTAC
ncbi:MAG: hypothetical protein ACI3YH_07095 [Eubacteriales bacterium]